MPTSLRSTSLLSLGLLATLGLSLSVVQAAQDGRGRGRGASDRGRAGEPELPSQKEMFFRICDHDDNQWVSFREANFSLRIDRSRFARIDTDTDGRLSLDEFGAYYDKTQDSVGSFKEPVAMPGSSTRNRLDEAPDRVSSPESDAPVTASTIRELFGVKEQRDDRPNTVPLPPRIQGPVSHFSRLDLDEDGRITVEDLEWLARPMHLDVRFPAVIAIIDTDHDGGISSKELRASMR